VTRKQPRLDGPDALDTQIAETREKRAQIESVIAEDTERRAQTEPQQRRIQTRGRVNNYARELEFVVRPNPRSA
jgi:hypothetical protein